MAEPTDHITATRKNFVTNDNEGRMIKKCIVEIQGAFLVKIRNYAFNGNIGENVFEHIDKLLEIFGPIKINGLTQDLFRLSFFPVSLAGAASEWFTKECIGSITTWDNMFKKFILKFHHLSNHNKEEEIEEDDNLNKTDNNGGTKWPTCTSNIDGFCNGGELPGMVRVGSMTYFQDHRCLKSCFENFHELEYEVLVKLQECWWKVNAHKIAPFTRMENFKRGPYANMKTEWATNPYLDVNRIFGREYEAINVGCTQENQGHMGDPILEPSNCKVRRFEMMKYSFDNDEEYITIKESEYLNHSKDSLDAYRELLRTYIDKKCPFTGDVSIRGRILAGTCHSAKMVRTIIVRRDYLHYVKKYQRYEKRHSNIPAHISPCFRVKEGDHVTVGQCRAKFCRKPL
ncbi:retrotransposon ORF1 [Tanacetum coccineum]